LHRFSILVVEDEHLVAFDLATRLRRMGHEAHIVHTGEAALARVTQVHVDVVLMDIKLKGELDGITAAERLRRIADIPVIYVTAYADSETLARARATEPYGYVLKPFQDRELRAAIEMTLQKHANDRSRAEQQQLHHFLADASVRMTDSLDYRIVAAGAADVLVPRYADWCLITLEDQADGVGAFSYSHPGTHAAANAPLGPIVEVVKRERRTRTMLDVRSTSELGQLLGAAHTADLAEIGARSAVCVPLLARGQSIGVLAAVIGSARAPYTHDDLMTIEDFAHRLAIALDNALLYRRAERAVQMRDDVLAIVSHDLRGPLSTILLRAEALTTHPELGPRAVGIVRAAQRMHRLIGDLLDASAINAGHLMLAFGRHLLRDIVVEATDMFRPQAEQSAITLIDEVPAEPVWLRCDRDRILQVLGNLLSNALKFTPAGGLVTVRAIHEAGTACFEVTDTGRGIPPDQVPHLFDRFWRAEARREGAGLGLFISRAIVAAHDGTLEVETRFGHGSRFHFSLPVIS
jgi:signal transduction histidine kinase